MATEVKQIEGKTCSAILNVMQILTSSSTQDVQTKSHRNFDEVILEKIQTFRNVLRNDENLETVLFDYQQNKHDIFEFCESFFVKNRTDPNDQGESSGDLAEKSSIRWTFVEICLYLLSKLKEVLKTLSQTCENMNQTKENPNPKLRGDALGVNDQKTVLTCLQFIIGLGVCPNLLPGVGIPVEKRSDFFELIKGDGEESPNEAHLMKCLTVLLDCVKHPSIGATILARHLGDILTGLIQVCYKPQESCHLNMRVTNEKNKLLESDLKLSRKINNSFTEHDNKEFRITNTESSQVEYQLELQKLLDRVYQPLIIKELLAIQGNAKKKNGRKPDRRHLKETKENKGNDAIAPNWFADVCGRLLSERVMKPNGVHAVLTAVLESSGASNSSLDWRKCDMVAMVIASCPMQANSIGDYYQHISPQVIKLLHMKHGQTAKLFVRVASSTAKAMLKRDSNLASTYFLNVLMAPLMRVTQCPELREHQPYTLLCDEESLATCIEDIYKVFVVGSDPQSSFLLSLHQVIHAIFELFCFTKKGISHLRSFCQGILVRYLRHVDVTLGLKTLYVLAYRDYPPDHPVETPFEGLISMDALASTTMAEKIASKSSIKSESVKKPPSVPIKSEPTFSYCNHLPILMRQDYSYCHGDGGGIVIKIDHDSLKSFDDVMERLRGDYVMEHEVRASCLVEVLVAVNNDTLSGDFFLQLMSKLTGIVGGNEQTSIEDKPDDLQVYDRRANLCQKNLLTLQLVAVMCDKLGPSILQNCTHMLVFIKSTLQRGCVLCHSEPLEEALTSETLTMAFGMLSAILGGAAKVEAKERKLLEELISCLEKLSLNHIDPKVKDMANDLRIAIATYGAVWSEQMKQAAENLGKAQGGMSEKTIKPSADDVTFEEAFRELCDPLVPVRGHAIITIASLLHKKNKRALSQSDTLLKIFMDHLSHDDSYIYLAAVQGLAALSFMQTDVILPYLAREFAACRRGTVNDITGSAASQRSPEAKMKLGEVLVKTVRDCGELVPCYSQLLLSSLLSGVRDSDEFVRASSLSNIGEVCKLLRFSIGPIVNEIFNCLNAVLKTEKSSQVRRSAILVVTSLLGGMGKDAIQALGSSLKDLYHMIKLVEACDEDELTRQHAQQALGELDTIMRDFLFPKQTFSKKIQVLP